MLCFKSNISNVSWGTKDKAEGSPKVGSKRDLPINLKSQRATPHLSYKGELSHSILVSCHCHNEVSQTGWLNEIYSLSHSSGGPTSKISIHRLNSRCQRSLQRSWRWSIPCLFQMPYSLARGITPISAPIVTSPHLYVCLPLPLARTFTVAFKAQPDNPGLFLHFKLFNLICKDPFVK